MLSPPLSPFPLDAVLCQRGLSTLAIGIQRTWIQQLFNVQWRAFLRTPLVFGHEVELHLLE